MIPRVASLCSLLLACSEMVNVQAATLRLVRVERFFVAPNQSAPLQWKIEAGELSGPLQYTLSNYCGKLAGTGQATVAANGTVEATVKLAAGYYELEFPATKQRFGLVALPACEGPADPLFAIDGALSWLVRDDAVRDGLVRAARRSGISMIRERLTWGAVNPAEGRWDWEASVRFGVLRAACAAQGVPVLEMAHDAPAWMGRVGKYPDNLAAAARSWGEIAQHWRSSWGGLEIWNEPDIFFGDNLPADQYVALVRAIAYRSGEDRLPVPIVGGVVAHHNRPFLDTAAENGLLNCTSVFSFHTYGRATEMEKLVGDYRAWLTAHGHGSMPLWITECGRPWKKGPPRPPADQDAESALDITMKAIEARACGIARYFAFVYPFYEEGTNNFGMMDKRGTPLRSMAAYAQAARALAKTKYIGDLNVREKGVQRARVFANDRGTVAVLYTGRVNPAATLHVALPVLRAEGIDGRLLQVVSGAVAVPDGLVYLWLDPAKIGGDLKRETTAAKLTKIAQAASPPPAAQSPIILRYEFDRGLVEAIARGYRIKTYPKEGLPIKIKACNLGSKAFDGSLRLEIERGRVLGEPGTHVQIPPGKSAEHAWHVSVDSVSGWDGAARLRVQVGEPHGTSGSSSLVFCLYRQSKATEVLNRIKE